MLCIDSYLRHLIATLLTRHRVIFLYTVANTFLNIDLSYFLHVKYDSSDFVPNFSRLIIDALIQHSSFIDKKHALRSVIMLPFLFYELLCVS